MMTEDDYVLSRFIVTLKLLGIYKNMILIEDLGATVWIPAANYLMARKEYP
jgi:hypothetical protein